MPNLLHQIDLLNFSLGDFAGAIALVVSAVTFYISHTQASQSEQIKTSREIWSGIEGKYNSLIEKAKNINDKSIRKFEVRRECLPVLKEIDYFAYLILNDEIKDKVVLGYYKDQLSRVIGVILEYYSPDELRAARINWHESLPNFDRLITKWEIQHWPI